MVDIRYLPPYSPFINPIQYIFHMFKQSVEQENPQDKEALKRSIDTFIPTVNPQKATSCFMHVVKYYPQAAVGLPFHGKPLDPIVEVMDDAVVDHTATPQPLLLLQS